MLELKTELNKPISSEIQDRMNGIWNLGHVRLSNQLKEYYKQRNEVFEFALRNICKPPIKGEITVGINSRFNAVYTVLYPVFILCVLDF